MGVLDPECDNGDDHIRDENDESEESRYSGGRHRHHHSASWFPSQIDVAISSGVGVADAVTCLTRTFIVAVFVQPPILTVTV